MGMNKLPTAKRVQILSMMVEGASMRAISRVADVSINTVTKLLVDAGECCLEDHDELVRGVGSKRVQCDEIWSFCYAKAKNVPGAKAAPAEAGDVWTWTALDSDSKLMLSYVVAGRSQQAARVFMHDLAGRVSNRIQLTSDGFPAYPDAVELAFGADVDFAQLIKSHAHAPTGAETRYSPADFVSAKKVPLQGEHDLAHVSTSHVERANLTIRMGNRRFTRLTNAFSKKYAHHLYMLAIFFMHYNFVRSHKSLRMSPAMAAGVSKTLWSMEDIVARMDAVAPKPGRPATYRKNSN